MKARWISASVLVAFAIVVHAGCGEVVCPPGTMGPYNNRCFIIPPSPPPPPEPPDLSQSGFQRVDSSGPRDRNAVAISAILVESCIHDVLIPEFNINARIDALYNARMKSAVERAIGNRTECLSNSEHGRGCDRVRKCLGIAITPDEPAFAEGCTGPTAMRRRVSPSGTVYNDWFNCEGMNIGEWNLAEYLECYPAPYPRCDTERQTCTSEGFLPCEHHPPTSCEYSAEEGESFTHAGPGCVKGTTCTMEGDTPVCTGTGPACTETFAAPAEIYLDFRAGIACEDATTLRACVNGHEQLIDCTPLGQAFTCIDGSRPHCGVDFQCGYEGLYPLPTCGGTFITVCNAGEPRTIDCRSLGFETCDPERGVCK